MSGGLVSQCSLLRYGTGKAQALANHLGIFLLFTERTPTSDEVLRRVGRNLVIFQQIEHSLKLLLANHKNAGHIDNYAANLRTRAESINKRMMGHLVEKYATEVLRDAGEEVPETERPADWFSFSFHISGETGFIEGLRRDLKIMTDERNELVHHFLPRWQPGNYEALTETMAYLDAQREKVLPMHEHLRSTVQHLNESAKSFAEFVTSPEYQKKTELMWLQGSPLVALMCEVTEQHRRNDGWTYLAQAGNLAARELPDEIKHLKERYGFKTLKKLLFGAEMFDVMDEPLSEGNFRTLYRLKAGILETTVRLGNAGHAVSSAR